MIRSEHLDALMEEIGRANEKHGTWDWYTPVQIHKAVSGEFKEFRDALIAGDYHGEHGMARELLQVAATALKGYVVLSQR